MTERALAGSAACTACVVCESRPASLQTVSPTFVLHCMAAGFWCGSGDI